MLPPEIILDRFVKAGSFPPGYVGKLDIERVKSPSLRTFLEGLQVETNEALGAENANASGGVVHPPIHFDFLDSTIPNAHAIPLDDYWFIVLTLPLVISVSDTAKALIWSDLSTSAQLWGVFCCFENRASRSRGRMGDD